MVREATRRSDGEKFAVKIVDKAVIKDDIKLLKREIDIMKKVQHSNILHLYEIFEDEQHVYIVMELINGSELFDRIVDKGYYSEKNTVHIVKQILSAVAYLHEMGIAHRDLKVPSPPPPPSPSSSWLTRASRRICSAPGKMMRRM